MSRRISFRRAKLPGPKSRIRGMAASASRVPSIPATTASSTHSTSNCRTIRPALAPSAERTAISRVRLSVRANERLATLAPAISNTQNTAPPSIHNASRDSRPTMYRLNGTTPMVRVRSAAGTWSFKRLAMVRISVCAS